MNRGENLRFVSTVSANFREYSRKTAEQFEKLKRPQIIYSSQFRDGTQNFANLGKTGFFHFRVECLQPDSATLPKRTTPHRKPSKALAFLATMRTPFFAARGKYWLRFGLSGHAQSFRTGLNSAATLGQQLLSP
jgi:hypothetical protein